MSILLGEVSRSLVHVKGAVLVVDAAQGGSTNIGKRSFGFR